MHISFLFNCPLYQGLSWFIIEFVKSCLYIIHILQNDFQFLKHLSKVFILVTLLFIGMHFVDKAIHVGLIKLPLIFKNLHLIPKILEKLFFLDVFNVLIKHHLEGYVFKSNQSSLTVEANCILNAWNHVNNVSLFFLENVGYFNIDLSSKRNVHFLELNQLILSNFKSGCIT